MSHRYFTQAGQYPKIEACFVMSGPQDAEQIPECVRILLDR